MEKPVSHIAVIRLSALGDVAMLVPVLTQALKQYPELHFTLVTKGFNAPVFNNIERLTVIEAQVYGKHKGISGLFKLANELKKQQITQVADMHQVLRSKVLRNFLRIKGCKVQVIDKGRKEKKALTKPTNKPWKPLKTTHTRYCEVLSNLGYPVALNQFEPLKRIALPEEAQAILKNFTGKLVGIAPFAAFQAKTYSLAQMRQVLELLDAIQQYKVLLFGAPNQQEDLNVLQQDLQTVSSVAGILKFNQELAVISNLDVMVSMDSANGHLAANYGIPVITLWGVTHPYLGFAPFGQKERSSLLPDLDKYPKIPTSVYGKNNPEGYHLAINSIAPTVVVEKIQELT